MKKKITIDDIARALNVSKTAVSFAINGKASEKLISVELENRIMSYIEEVGYRPNHFAQGLRTGKTKMIAMMVEDISDPFFSAIARLMEEAAYKREYKILYSSTENDHQKTRDLIDAYRGMQVDGYIIAPPLGIENELKGLTDDGYTVVLFDRTLPGIELNSVVVDNYTSSYSAVNYLLNNGYENIAMITLLSEQIQMAERRLGYLSAVTEAGRPYLLKRIAYHDQQEHAIFEIEEFLKAHQQIDAVFFATNYIADSGLEAIRNLMLQIPDDIAVIVFDDDNFYRLHTPSITAIAQPIKEISEQVINMILKLLASPVPARSVNSIVLPTKLMIRNSTLPKVSNKN
ncbi:transcriptional regulator, LacI family [Mucilaginibacter mallensis]|uniref:Transcriptional regulator, LacI family n=1 Tax=Mucilaginibacter mallensis TaxID=652787 RepID=A0A1H1ZRY0_MUCMA|nr:substrate-binding domain-containing protein [Mucilaginibacter mallensis]SDT36545.1 transcriptional regulator, LacI family [Mucilaginibacter mallensis]